MQYVHMQWIASALVMGIMRLYSIKHPSIAVPSSGTQLWVKLRGMCHWPVVMWSLDLCMKKDMPQLLTSFKPGNNLQQLALRVKE